MLNQWLANALDHSKMSQSDLARRLSTAIGRHIDRSMVNKMVKGTREISGDEVIAIAKITGVSLPVFMDDDGNDLDSRYAIPIIGEAAAGLWREHDEEAFVNSLEHIPGVLLGSLTQSIFGLKVAGNSMNRRGVEDGNVVLVRSIFDAPELRHGDIVAVRRRQGHLTELTIKELHLVDGRPELWPNSTDPSFQKPLKFDPETHMAEDGTSVEIIGLVQSAIKSLTRS